MLSRILYYIILLPISWVPLRIAYLFSNLIFFVLFHLIKYRKKVILFNISRSFPNDSKKVIQQKTKDFYWFLSNLVIESISNLSLSEKELRKRMTFSNPELIQNLYSNNKNVIILSSHFNNWEFLISAQNLISDHQAIGIGMPLTNSYLNKKINARRERFGLKVVDSKNYKSEIEKEQNPISVLIVGDQAPSNSENSFWAPFLNRTTPFYFGGEIMANQLDSTVVYASIKHVKRGHYNVEFKLISENPISEKYGYITQSYIKCLEDDIKLDASKWLWSHKRWKREIPADLNTLKAIHKERFNDKFRTN